MVRLSALVMKLQVILCQVAVLLVDARSMEESQISNVQTLNALNFLADGIGIVYRYMRVPSSVAAQRKYVVTYDTLWYLRKRILLKKHSYLYLRLILSWFCSFLDKAKIRAISTCEVGGKTYHLGERIYPENTCYECHCAPDYNNATSLADNSNCVKINCGETFFSIFVEWIWNNNQVENFVNFLYNLFYRHGIEVEWSSKRLRTHLL